MVGRGCKQDYCGATDRPRATGMPQATFKIIRGGPCCLPPVPTHMQAELNLCRTHILFCWFCHAPAHLYLIPIPKLITHSLTREMTIGCVSSRTHKVLFAKMGMLHAHKMPKKYQHRQKVLREYNAEYGRKG